jgi:sugar/nucleoside kinase (ribokinase family)
VQINSSNLGHQSLFKYQNIDSLFINEGELRFQTRDKVSDIKQLIKNAKKNKIRNIFVTRGAAGVIVCDVKKNFYSCPAFSAKITDKVGAGDTFLAVTAVALASKVPMDISLFIGSLCAGYSVGYHANKKIIVKENLLNDINSLL